MLQKQIGSCSPFSFVRIPIGLLFMMFAGVAFTGCAERPGGDPRITPPEKAREALESSMKAWQNGQPPGMIEATSPPVQVVDSVWKRGEKLKNYEILGEETDPEGLRWFSVRLQLEKSDSSQPVKYLVMGSTSITVFREEDYNLSRSWKTMDKK
jgi:hypothetical protein